MATRFVIENLPILTLAGGCAVAAIFFGIDSIAHLTDGVSTKEDVLEPKITAILGAVSAGLFYITPKR